MNPQETNRISNVSGDILNSGQLNLEGQLLVTSFITDLHCRRAVEKYEYYLTKGLKPEDQVEFRSQFVGYTFEHLSQLWMRKHLKQNEVLLSPEWTFHVYELLYPEKKIIRDRFSFFSDGIEGVSLPDGIILAPSRKKKTTNIIGVVEYTSARISEFRKIQFKIMHSAYRATRSLNPLFSLNDPRSQVVGKFIHKRFPDLPAEFSGGTSIKSYWVLPSDRVVDESLKLNEENIFRLPLTTHQFSQLINLFIENSKYTTVHPQSIIQNPTL